MNEEIVFGMGLDTSSFEKNLGSARFMVKAAAVSIKESFAEMGRAFLAPFAAAASVEGVRKVVEFGESIKRGAEIAGTSTDFYQTLGGAMRATGGDAETGGKGLEKLTALIGEARKGNASAVESFGRLGISLNDNKGAVRDTESIFRELADRIHNAATAEERAQIATDAFGKKLGLELIPALQGGSAALDKFGSTIRKLSEEDLQALSDLHRGLSDSATTSQIFVGKLIGAWSQISGIAGTFYENIVKLKNAKEILGTAAQLVAPGGQNYAVGKSFEAYGDSLGVDQFKEEQAKKRAAAEAAHQQDFEALQEITRLFGVLKNAQDTADYAAMSDQEKLYVLDNKKGELDAKIAALASQNLNTLDTEIELQAVTVELEKEKLLVHQHQVAEKKRELELQQQINDAKRKADSDSTTLKDLRSGKAQSQYTLEELANNPNKLGGRLGDDQENAKRIIADEQLAQKFKDQGDPKLAADYFRYGQNIRANLSSNVVESDRHPFGREQSAAEDSTAVLRMLLNLAAGEGIKVIPSMQ